MDHVSLDERLQALQDDISKRALDSMEESPFIDGYLSQLIDPALRSALQMELQDGHQGILCTFDVKEWQFGIVSGPLPGSYLIQGCQPIADNAEEQQIMSSRILRAYEVQTAILLLLRDLLKPDLVASQLNRLLS